MSVVTIFSGMGTKKTEIVSTYTETRGSRTIVIVEPVGHPADAAALPTGRPRSRATAPTYRVDIRGPIARVDYLGSLGLIWEAIDGGPLTGPNILSDAKALIEADLAQRVAA